MQESTLISNSALRYSKHPALVDIVKERDLPVKLIEIMESAPRRMLPIRYIRGAIEPS